MVACVCVCVYVCGGGVIFQLALALARLWEIPGDTTFRIPDQQALCSLLSFLGGALIGRLGDRMGPNTRIWLFTGT